MKNNYVLDDYFDWLYFQIKKRKSFRKLLMTLHDIEFDYSLEYDANRADDGVNLRWYYVKDGGDEDILSWKSPCSVLEMIFALAIHMEKILDEPDNKMDVRHWVWFMIDNLGLSEMDDKHFDKEYVHRRIEIFLNRDYEPDGDGNVICIPDCVCDLRDMEIWQQMCWYIDTII